MKKIFLLLLGISLLTSCSSDSESVTYNDSATTKSESFRLKSGTVDPVLKDLYLRMINSQSFIDSDSAITVFLTKLGPNIPDSELSSGPLMLRWIENNISLTGFSSYPSALSEYNNLESLCSASLAANYQFYEYLEGAGPGVLLPILEEQQPVPTDCPNCTSQFNTCSNAAHSTYMGAVAKAATSFRKGDMSQFGYRDKCLEAQSVRNKALDACRRTYNACCAGF